MAEEPGRRNQNKDKSLGYFHAEAATGATEDAADGYQTASLVAAGADAEGVALLAAISRLPIVFLYSKVPRLVTLLGSRKRALLALTAVDAFSWIPLIAVLLFLKPVSPFWLTVCWLINLVPGTLSLPARDSWLADKIPPRVMGRYLGMRSLISAAIYLGMFFLMGHILDMFADQIFVALAIVLVLALTASSTKTLIYSRMGDPASAVDKPVNFGLADFMEETKKGGLERFILYVSALNFAVFLSAPFFAIYMLTYLNFSYTTFAVVFASDFIGRALSASAWGKYCDEIGSLPVLRRLSYFLPIIPILWLISPNPVYLVAVQLFSGVVWSGYEVASQSLIYRTAAPDKRSGYIVYQKSLTTLGQAGGALAAAYLFNHIFPLFGSRILALFLLSGVLRFSVGRALLPGMIHARESGRDDEPERQLQPSGQLATAAAPTAAYGLYHRPKDWAKYTTWTSCLPSAPVPVMAHGLYQQPEKWARYRTMTSEIDATTPAMASVPAHGLYHKPEKWAKYRARTSPIEILAPAQAAVPARGLYHEPEKWAKYRARTTSIEILAPAQAAVPARGLYHKPEEWAKYRIRAREETVAAVVAAPVSAVPAAERPQVKRRPATRRVSSLGRAPQPALCYA